MTGTDPLAGEAQWLVCHTKPRCEKKFAAIMTAENLKHYLPLLETAKRYDGRIKRFSKPLFPGYVFACVPNEKKARIYQQDLLARAIPVTDIGRFLAQMEDVHRLVASGLELTVMPLLAKGRAVKITSGPLRGLEGYVDNPRDPRSVIISVDVLQQGLLVPVPLSDLTVLP